MRVTFKQDGGFAALPGLSKAVTIDSQVLPVGTANQLDTLVKACSFFELPPTMAVHPGAADTRRTTITISDGKRRHTVVRADPIEDVQVQALVAFLQDLRRAE